MKNQNKSHPNSDQGQKTRSTPPSYSKLSSETDKLEEAAGREPMALRQEILYKVLRAMSGKLNLPRLAQSVVETLSQITNYPHICLAFPDKNGTHWVVCGAAGNLSPEIGATYPIHQGIIGRAFKTGQMQWVRDKLEDPSYIHDANKADTPAGRSEIVVLMKGDDRLLGALKIEGDQVDAFDNEDVELIQALAEVIALGVENAQLYQDAQQEITERIRAEETIRASEQKLRTLFNIMSEGIALNEIIYNGKGEMVDYRILEVNEAFYKMADYEPGRVIGNVATSLYSMSPEAIKSFWEDHKNAVQVVRTEYVSPRTNRIYMVSTSPFKNGRFVTSFFDITGQKQAEQKLARSNKRFRQLFENSGTGIIIVDENGRYLLANKVAAASFGKIPEEVAGKSMFDFLPREVAEHYLDFNRQLIRTGGDREYEDTFQLPTGERSFLIQDRSIQDENGRNFAIQSSSIDITERKQTEDRLKDSEERYRDLVENSQELIYTHDLHGKLLSVNHTAALTLGYTATSLIGRNLVELLAPEQGAQFEDYLGRVRRKISDSGAWVLQSVNGDKRLWEYHSMLRSDAKQSPYVRGMAHDITERTLAETALRDSEERFHKIFDEGPVGMVLTGRDQHFFSANPAFCRMLGYTTEEMNAKTFLEVTHPEHREQDRENVEKMWRGGIPVYRTEKRYIAKNGEIRWGSLSATLIRGQAEEPLYALAMIEDISERKRAEEAIRKRNTELAALNQIGQALSKLAEPDEILELIFSVIGQVLDNRNLFIALYDHVSHSISFPVYAINGEREPDASRPLGNGLTDHVIRTNAPLLIKQNLVEVMAERGIEMIGAPSRSFLAVPMRHGDQVIGVIALQDYDRENAFDEQQLELLTTIAAQASTALENARLLAEVQEELQELKQTEEKLGASEAFNQALIKHSPIGVSVRTRTGQLLYANDAWKQIWGTSDQTVEEDLTRERNSLVFDQRDDYLKPHLEDLRKVYEEGGILYMPNLKTTNPRPGAAEWISQYFYALKDEGGAVSRVVILTEDISERNRAESELAKSHEQLRALSQYLQAAREEERTFIAREIHDELGQELTALKMDLAWLARQLPPEQIRLVRKTTAMATMVDGTIQTVRRVASELRPGLLDDLGLVAALEWQAGEFQARTGIRCKLTLPENVTKLDRDEATAIFRIFQETLTNIARHAQATKVRVTLREEPASIVLAVHDNGIGITQDQLDDPRSLGLTGMRERVQAFGGVLDFKSAPGKGTSVRLRMPRAAMHEEKEI